MAKQSAADKAEIQRRQAEARAFTERANLDRRRSEVAEVLRQILEDATAVSGSLVGTTTQNSERIGERKQLRRFTGATWLKVTPSVFEPFLIRNGANVVPADFWNLDELEDGREVAVVACPCGEEPVIPLGNFHICEGKTEEEDCRRVFFFMGKEIRAIRVAEQEWPDFQPDPESAAA